MSWLWQVLVVPCILFLVVVAGLRFGAPGVLSEFGQLVCMLLPLLAMVLVCFRVPDALPSLAVFGYGIALDLMAQEPLGYWPLILLVGTALAKLQPQQTRSRLVFRLMWLVVVAAGVLCSFVIIESLYLLSMPAFASFVSAVGVFVLLGWGFEILFALLGTVRFQVPDRGNLVRGEN